MILGPSALTWRPGLPMNLAPVVDLDGGAMSREVRVRLMIVRARGLANADMFGKSDPFVTISWRGERVHKTATIDDDLNPEWENEQVVVSVVVPTAFEATQTLRGDDEEIMMIEVFDEDPTNASFLGEVRRCRVVVRLGKGGA